MSTLAIARTNVQLFNQLIIAGKPEALLRRAYDAYWLAASLYSGHFHADGKPFLNHGIAVASTVAHLGVSDDTVVAAIVHNIYMNGDFGDGLRDTITPARRARVRAAVGVPVDDILNLFRDLRIRRTLHDTLRNISNLTELEREIMLMDLADHYEKYLDGSLAYYGDCQWILDFDQPNMAGIIELAAQLGHPEFGEMLAQAINEQSDWFQRVPAFLRTADGLSHMKVLVPGSCERKAVLRRADWRMRQRARFLAPYARRIRKLRKIVRLRKRIRSLLSISPN